MTELTLSLGARRCWRDFTGGSWETDTKAEDKLPAQERGKTRCIRHKPAVYKGVRVTEAEAEGLIVASQEWAEANKRQVDPAGYINRMIQVDDVRRNVAPDPELMTPTMAIVTQVADRMAEAIATAIAKALRSK